MNRLLAPDAALPQRDVLLDGAAMAPRLRRLGHLAAGETVAVCRVKYRVGDSLRVAYRTSGQRVLAARTVATGASERAQQLEASGGRGYVACDEALSAVITRVPFDRKLGSLRTIVEPAAASATTGFDVARTELVAYAPEKSATARLLDAAGRELAYAKVYPDDQGGSLTALEHDLNGACANLPRTRVPRFGRTLCYFPELRVRLLEPVAGTVLAESARDGEWGWWALGRVLAQLHLLSIDAPAFRRVEAERIETAAALVALARPSCGSAAERLAELLGIRPPNAANCLLHGDVHGRNAIVTSTGLALIDLDQAARGPAAADLGSAIAALRCAALVGQATRPAVARAERALLAGYGSAGLLPHRSQLAWHVAAALLAERCVRAINRVRPRTLARLDRVLAHATEVVGAA